MVLTSKVIHITRRHWITILAVILAIAIPAIYVLHCALYPIKYEDTINAVADEYDLPPSLLYAVIHTESHFQPDVTSAMDARGLMQITDVTYNWARQMGKTGDKKNPDTLYDPQVNIRYGALILHLLYKEFPETETVLAAYNAGQGHVRRWLQNSNYSHDGSTLDEIPFTETRNYVKQVLRTQKRYQKFYHID